MNSSYKKLLQEAIDREYQTMAANIITLAIMEGEPVEEWTDLHYKAMLLLALPVPAKKKVGRPKAYTEIDRRWLSYVCAVKAHITGNSFSSTWHEYADHVTRRLRPDLSPVQLAKLIKIEVGSDDVHVMLEDGSEIALIHLDEVKDVIIRAMKVFDLSQHDIDKVVFDSVIK